MKFRMIVLVEDNEAAKLNDKLSLADIKKTHQELVDDIITGNFAIKYTIEKVEEVKE